ncbi:MAG: hypothetical protein V8S99_02990 [Oscillospiraceae bacterium]
MKLLQMSLAGGVMILVITVIRALAIERLPKKTFLALWAAALARLLAPVSLPSALSIYSLLARRAPAAAEWTAVPALPDFRWRRRQQRLPLRSRQLPRLRRSPRSGRSSGL